MEVIVGTYNQSICALRLCCEDDNKVRKVKRQWWCGNVILLNDCNVFFVELQVWSRIFWPWSRWLCESSGLQSEDPGFRFYRWNNKVDLIVYSFYPVSSPGGWGGGINEHTFKSLCNAWQIFTNCNRKYKIIVPGRYLQTFHSGKSTCEMKCICWWPPM